ncbi:Sorbitol dehydrogenase [Pirellula sp. SH-Sr6A]|nr:Sorbitol dehydrogenase [Pirellula sp. SH-Sr6A]
MRSQGIFCQPPLAKPFFLLVFVPLYLSRTCILKALLLQEYKKLAVVDLPQPECGPEDLLVQVKACGICGSDIHGFDGSSGRRIPPLVMGHEAAGIVVEVGSAVRGFSVGDRVTFDSTVSCGKCHFCRAGSINLCENRQVLGVACNEFRRQGAFAQFVTVPQHIAYPIPESLPFEHAAMIEAVSIAVHATNRTPKHLGGSVVVVGAGMIGLLCIQTLKLAGFAKIIAIDLEDEKLQLALKLGATHSVNPKKEDPVARVMQWTNGRGADASMEVVGAKPTVSTCFQVVRRGGSVTLVGNLTPAVELPLQTVVTRELSVFGSCASNGEIPQCIELLSSGAIQVQPLITATASLEEVPQWFDRLYAGEKGAMKVIVTPNR